MGDIEVELFFQRLDPVELSLASQEMSETDSCSFAVQVAFKVEKVSFKE